MEWDSSVFMRKAKVFSALEDVISTRVRPEIERTVRRTTQALFMPQNSGEDDGFAGLWEVLDAEAQDCVRQIVFSFQAKVVKIALLGAVGPPTDRAETVFRDAADIEAFSRWSQVLGDRIVVGSRAA